MESIILLYMHMYHKLRNHVPTSRRSSLVFVFMDADVLKFLREVDEGFSLAHSHVFRREVIIRNFSLL